ncbi:TPA: DNA-directed RNA polymerase subunit alpha [candidate division CPR2 bacterium]|uniref:DNA-directed RNA polymerase subunit alpha n=1 Tax=candidate division CPR2 bacterium GW2011_GWC1_41_48 TaxID=1618344 RepID=A0A0G0W7A3_UNCC2|nr:MAG: DNA-directed RNA polymerase subunit alpha [candidate division CPR2 bacterium GW2011_GWC2_39_35]KKR27174.1 MAG: DNA-directed RNA polymerase subunit alpha [candidate division CPR2 bacterium GW2011_GWD2_39_7]KKR29184.1 MAG: DNA-directed RNA polymerase subunit alpha [candidate division CPR2 bacterium GW2011_GWD1_39_7]KKS08860.1 MAG: DNA-directed RNA polymerase, alpha subunit, DNA-directed RNA polymerase subunit alpha [candidate division CPR2 bacterium GW2011_GWC1_41_48]OGB70323.1 MAG: DNA-d
MIQNIHLPEVKTIKEEGNLGIFSIEPLYPGYGMTLGNSLRRVILSSLPGAAVTAVKIDGVTHEFTTIPNVKEDVVEVLLNLKQLRVKSFSDEEQYLYLSASGQGKVSAKNIKAPSQVEIINPDLHLATLDGAKAKLEMEVKIEKGRGYVPVEKREGEKLQVGMIAVDAIYTPIKKVRYNVESTRVGQMTDLDKLVIEIETDGTITPKDAVNQAAEILVDHFSVVAGREVAGAGMPTETQKPERTAEDAASKILVEEVNLSPRTTNALLNNDIKTIADILKLTDDELRSLKGFGNKAYQEVREKLDELGFSFEGGEE